MTPAADRTKLPRRWAALAALSLAASLIIWIWGPGWALRLGLDLLLPRLTGLTISYDQVTTGPWGRGLTLDRLALDSAELGRLTIGRVEISDLKPLNLLRTRPGLDLAGQMDLADLRWEQAGWTLAAPTLRVLRPGRPATETDLPFYQLDLADLRGKGPGFHQFQAKNLSLGNAVSSLAGLRFQASTEAGLWTGEARLLALDSFGTSWERWQQNEGQVQELLPELFQLRVDSGHLALNGRQALLMKAARPEYRHIFTKFSSEAVSYNYYLELTLNPSNLAQADYFWADLADLTGDFLDLEMSLDLTIDPRERALQVRGLSLDGRNLGRLDLTAELSDLAPGRGTTAEILSAIYLSRIHNLSLSFQNQGVMARYYALWAEGAGWDADEVPARLKEKILTSLFGPLDEEGGLANLQALDAAAAAFLNQPEYIMLSAEPSRPPALASLVKMGRYAIIDRLGITLTVNDQPPVLLVAAPGSPLASEGQTPSFQEENLPRPRPEDRERK